MTNKNGAPERINVGGGVWQPEGFKAGMWWGHIVSPDDGFAIIREVSHGQAKLMAKYAQPVPSESDEAVAHLKNFVPEKDFYYPNENPPSHVVSAWNFLEKHESKHRQPAAQPVPHVEVSKTALPPHKAALADIQLAEHVVALLNHYGISIPEEKLPDIEMQLSWDMARFRGDFEGHSIGKMKESLDAHALRAGELVREAAIHGVSDFWQPGKEHRLMEVNDILRALDVAAIIKGDK